MVEDNNIKATVSPFAIREGEIKVFDGKDGYVSMNQIIHRINIGHINEIHFVILELVNEFEFITSRQLLQMLEWKKIDVGSQEKLNNKFETRELLKDIVPMLKYYMVKGIDFKYNDFNKIAPELVIQLPVGSGGSKTFFCNQANSKQVETILLKDELYSVSAYKKDNIPYNIHCLIGKNQIEILPPSQQELEIIDKIEYIGSNYDITIPTEIKNKLIKYSYNICEKLQSLGYLGVLGIDYIYTNNELYFIEINPRFQGSTRQIDKLLIESNLPSIFEYNYNLFLGKEMPTTKKIKYSLF